MRVYLAGPIAGCNDEEANGWRVRAKALRPDIEWVDPMEYMDARGWTLDAELAHRIVDADKKAILGCHAVLRNAERPTEGSAQEVMYAFMRGRRIISFTSRSPSPWVIEHSVAVYGSLEAAVAAL